jgi:1-deoxy-D-xylulose-5-phosphate synthase
MTLLSQIHTPSDLKALDASNLPKLAAEIRERLIAVCSANGGHLAPNLGVVELTIALHRVLDLPADSLIWDVGHQAYVHKLLTGRADAFVTLRTEGGISGFTNRQESPYDAFGAGHASTSVSAALGMAIARDLRGGKETIVAVLGDGALTGGLAYEALNNAGSRQTNLIVILNDNEMSIAPNVGSIASYLSRLRSKPFFSSARERAKGMLEVLPFGRTAKKAITAAEVAAMRFVAPDEKAVVIFEEMGFRYIGPVDGHDIDMLTDVLQDAQKIVGPVLLHVRTKKGKGFEPAELDARTFHGCGRFNAESGAIETITPQPRTFSDAFGEAMVRIAERDSRIIGFTAAMPDGTKLSTFAKRFPERAFDVGIAEAHAVCAAAGAAAAGFKPVCAIYSTFLQRAYDQIIHDVVVQGLPVVFAIDRAGFVGDDGPTHMGMYDIPSLRALPNMTMMAPRNEDELGLMLEHAVHCDGPAALRYPRGSSTGVCRIAPSDIIQGKSEVLRSGSGVALLCLGPTIDPVWAALLDNSDLQPTVVNARFVAPLDVELLKELAITHHTFITLEEGALAGGFGSAVVEAVMDRSLGVRVERVGVGSELVAQASAARQREWFGLDSLSIAARIRAAFDAPMKENSRPCQALSSQ